LRPSAVFLGDYEQEEPSQLAATVTGVQPSLLQLSRQFPQLPCQRDELARQRRELPWVKVDKNYVFDAPQGKVRLADLFGPHSQLDRKRGVWGTRVRIGGGRSVSRKRRRESGGW